MLVRVDERDRTPHVWADWPSADGPQGLAVGPDAVWVLPDEGDQLLEVDPAGGGVTAHRLPFPAAAIAASRDAVFGVGKLGDGRVFRFTPGGAATSAPAGQVRALARIAVSAEYVWVVDEETATVTALDARSLEPVWSVRHPGLPCALFALGTQAWYVCTHVQLDILRLDAASRATERLRGLPGYASAAALAGDRLWVAGERREGPGEDPVTPLRCLGLDGRDITALELPGQIDAIGASEALVWVAGFRPSRQAHILTVLDAGGAVAGEVSLQKVNVTPWTPRTAAPARLPMPERAQAIRAAVAASLTEPAQAGNRFGDRWEEPPVSPEFQLERVDLRGGGDSYQIAVLFRWAGHDDLFGMRFDISPDDDTGYAAPDAYISVYVEENLLAHGAGLANATRDKVDGITWLRWS